MKTIEELLDFNPKQIQNLEKYFKLTRISINKDLDDKIQRLKAIKDINPPGPSNNMIQSVYREFKKLYSENPHSIRRLDLYKIGILTDSLDYKEDGNKSIFTSTNELTDFLKMINEIWNYIFLIGLFKTLMKNWGSNNDSFRILWEFVIDKIKKYNDLNPFYLILKNKERYFNYKNGNNLLGSDIVALKRKISEATKEVGLSDDYFKYPYFSQVIKSYVQKMGVDIFKTIDDLDETLKLHNNIDTKKIVISRLIKIANEDSNEDAKDKIKEMAIDYIGDPSIDAKWYSGGFSLEEQKVINEAKEYLNQWIIRQFISVFFEKCINDARRKQYWLKYSKQITRIKIFVSPSIYKMLLSVQGLTKYLNIRSHQVSRNTNISAIMFSINKHKFIEFSDQGFALNVYKLLNDDSPSFDPKGTVNSVEELRNSQLNLLVQVSGGDVYSFNQEGRFIHRNGILTWEQVLTEWMEKIGKIYV